ncbi:MAG: SurA N-terminal domain-containing protein [Halieaceae bacterium]|nr:SurA N-terminal domain-containing protein [Halieaceae bacterium]
MLQSIRKNIQGTMAKVIVGIIVVPFAFFGIESLFGGSVIQNVAEVNGQPITAAELQQQINLQRRQLLMSMGEDIDPSLLDEQKLAGIALEFLVQKLLLLEAASGYDMAISDQRINDLVTSMPSFQTEGQFDPQRYRLLLSDQGYTPAGFRKALREDILLSQLRSGIGGAEFVTASELALLSAIQEEQRDLRYLRIPIDRFKNGHALAESEVDAWYEANQLLYQTEENVSLDYIELRQEDFEPELTEAEVRELYELEKDSLQVAEIRAVSHILFEQGEAESEQDLRARIASVSAKLEADAANFPALARQYSEDPGSASLGGELGLTSGDTFPPEVEAAVARLALKEVSEPVESEAGWHLLLVTEIRGGATPAFDEVRMELEQRLRGERAQRELLRVVESLRDLVFNAEDLHGPASELSLSVSRQEGVTRSGGEGLFTNPQVINAAFSPDLLENAYNSDVLELNDGHFVVLRIVAHRPSETPPLAQVRDRVANEIIEDKARNEAVVHAEDLLKQLLAGASIEALALAEGYQWQVELGATRDNQQLPRGILESAFKLQTPAEGSVYDYVQTVEGDVELFEIFRVKPGNIESISNQKKIQLRQKMAEEWSRTLTAIHYQNLADSARVVRS